MVAPVEISRVRASNDAGFRFARLFHPASPATLSIAPIRQLVERYAFGGQRPGVLVDPFAGSCDLAGEWTNDLAPLSPACHHLHVSDFADLVARDLGAVDLVIWDPPYSPRQAKECYSSAGLAFTKGDAQECGRFHRAKRVLAGCVRPGGHVVCCGWSSGGFGRLLGFELVELLLVHHGSGRNDTIVTVERRAANLFAGGAL